MLKIELELELKENSRENQKYLQANLLHDFRIIMNYSNPTETIFKAIMDNIASHLKSEIKNMDINVKVIN